MAILLDTHAVLWLVAEAKMTEPALAAIDEATAGGGVLVSPVSAWEIGVLVSKNRLTLDRPPQVWLSHMLGLPGIRRAPLSPEMALQASLLPGSFHDDPADRLLVATARELDVPIVTRDGKILAYAAAGAVKAIAC